MSNKIWIIEVQEQWQKSSKYQTLHRLGWDVHRNGGACECHAYLQNERHCAAAKVQGEVVVGIILNRYGMYLQL